MTLTVAVVGERAAYIASDTRERYPDGHYVDAGTKVARLPGGWAAGGGASAWIDLVLRWFRPYPASDHMMQTGLYQVLYDSDLRRAIEAVPHTTTLGEVVVVASGPDGFSGMSFTQTGECLPMSPFAHQLCVPPDLPFELIVPQLGGAAVEEWDHVVRRLAGIFAWVAARSELVSPIMSLGYLSQRGSRYLPPTPVAQLLESPAPETHDFAVWIPTYANIGIGAGAEAVPLPDPIDVPAPDDLIVNGGFEEAAAGFPAFGWANWTVGISRVADDPYLGRYALRLDNGGVGIPLEAIQTNRTRTTGAFPKYQQLLRPVAGAAGIRVRAAGKWSGTGSHTAGVFYYFFDADQLQVSSGFALSWTTQTSWTLKEAILLVPAGAVSVAFSAVRNTDFTSDVFDLDDVHAFADAGIMAVDNQAQLGVTSSSTLTFALPGSALATDGEAVRIFIAGKKAATTGGPHLLVTFGATTVLDAPFPKPAAEFAYTILVRRTGTTSQVAMADGSHSAETLTSKAMLDLLAPEIVGPIDPQRTTPAETLASGVTITAKSSTTEGFDVDAWIIERVTT